MKAHHPYDTVLKFVAICVVVLSIFLSKDAFDWYVWLLLVWPFLLLASWRYGVFINPKGEYEVGYAVSFFFFPKQKVEIGQLLNLEIRQDQKRHFIAGVSSQGNFVVLFRHPTLDKLHDALSDFAENIRTA